MLITTRGSDDNPMILAREAKFNKFAFPFQLNL
jgi:hypothetical protein